MFTILGMIFMSLEIGLMVNESENGKREAAEFIKIKCNDMVSFPRYLISPCEEAKRLSEMSIFTSVSEKFQSNFYVAYFQVSTALKSTIIALVGGSFLKWISPPLIYAWNHHINPPPDLLIKT